MISLNDEVRDIIEKYRKEGKLQTEDTGVETMNKRITEKEFTKMVHDKMREANRFKEYERIPKNRIGGDYWNTYWTIRYMLRTIEDILANGDKLVLLGFFTVEPKFYKEKTTCSGMERTGKNVYEIPERYNS